MSKNKSRDLLMLDFAKRDERSIAVQQLGQVRQVSPAEAEARAKVGAPRGTGAVRVLTALGGLALGVALVVHWNGG